MNYPLISEIIGSIKMVEDYFNGGHASYGVYFRRYQSDISKK